MNFAKRKRLILNEKCRMFNFDPFWILQNWWPKIQNVFLDSESVEPWNMWRSPECLKKHHPVDPKWHPLHRCRAWILPPNRQSKKTTWQFPALCRLLCLVIRDLPLGWSIQCQELRVHGEHRGHKRETARSTCSPWWKPYGDPSKTVTNKKHPKRDRFHPIYHLQT